VMRAEVNDQVPTILAGWGIYPVGLEWQQTNWLEVSYSTPLQVSTDLSEGLWGITLVGFLHLE
jgi:hypothetical protein